MTIVSIVVLTKLAALACRTNGWLLRLQAAKSGIGPENVTGSPVNGPVQAKLPGRASRHRFIRPSPAQ